MADKNAAAQHQALVMSQLQRYNRAEADNYINYLNKVVVNLKETERIKKEVVDNYTNLSKVNPTYAAMLPQAMAEYNTAVLARAQAEANVAKAVADFKVLYP
jgi:pyrroline-5-carboxylate reductase